MYKSRIIKGQDGVEGPASLKLATILCTNDEEFELLTAWLTWWMMEWMDVASELITQALFLLMKSAARTSDAPSHP